MCNFSAISLSYFAEIRIQFWIHSPATQHSLPMIFLFAYPTYIAFACIRHDRSFVVKKRHNYRAARYSHKNHNCKQLLTFRVNGIGGSYPNVLFPISQWSCRKTYRCTFTAVYSRQYRVDIAIILQRGLPPFSGAF